ncbi:MAG: glucosylglycerol hydrolase, partial [Pseudomonadota bacterium]
MLDHIAQLDVDEAATEALIDFCHDTLQNAEGLFEAGQAIARRLGAHKVGDLCEIGFWIPELLERRVPDGDIFLEVLTPRAPLTLERSFQTATFDRVRLPVRRYEAFAFAAVRGMRAGTRAAVGHFYALTWRDGDGRWHRVFDPLAASLPFGAFAPAEYYDLAAMQAARGDAAYFEALRDSQPDADPVKQGIASNILQIHVPTATAGGSLLSLARQFEHLGER